ncbi:MAG: precorrin-4 C(11)-methyltransferase [Prevotellaceae bacterium]|nr:precorrin-4 C(11)-methyltransferase [Prevotellaceae bacterium]
MRKAIVTISDDGQALATIVSRELYADIIPLGQVEPQWHDYDAFVFISAMGICVRTIAPLLKDKHSDPAVVCMDTAGKNVISVVSGHVGGANQLATDVARAVGAMPVITTRSDIDGLWQLDLLGKRFGWSMEREDINAEIAMFVNRRPTALLLQVNDEGTRWLESNLPEHVTVFYREDCIDGNLFDLLVVVGYKSVFVKGIKATLHYIPKCLHVGIGLAHDADMKCIDEMQHCLNDKGIKMKAIKSIVTIDVKKGEKVVGELMRCGYEVRFYSAGELSDIIVPNPSGTVEKHVGTSSVSEAAAMLSADNNQLLLEKHKGTQWTLAVALDSAFDRSKGHVEIVGAGPGDPELVSIRGRKYLERADLILYAGSLVPRQLTECAKPGATVRNSATMALEEQCNLMKTFTDRGLLVVRLHTGDPCIYGAIQEQIDFFESHDISYHITPGISSFLAAAAELRSQFTIPGRCQTIILTRGEGRTPMPEREKLHLLARSRSTMCIFLSASIVDDVQEQLLQEYPADTPVAVCYHLTWKDQKIWRGKLSSLANIVRENHLTLTTMIVVGEAVRDNSEMRNEVSGIRNVSKLYDRHFTHLFRKGEE